MSHKNETVIDRAIQNYNDRLANRQEIQPGILRFTDVTLRDGQQQRTDEVTTAQRLQVFDELVKTGVDVLEIGHLGNKNGDQELARHIVKRLADMEQDSRFAAVKIQVLFGSQTEFIEDGCNVLREAFRENFPDNWQEQMKKRVVVHVYDRLDENLTKISSSPYTQAESAERVIKASKIAIDKGFVNFSISGEAATAALPEEAIEFYRTINDALFEEGAEKINVNLPNTYGFSPFSLWDDQTMEIFNEAVKDGYGDNVTTSIHAHNDVNSATEFSLAAVKAGFDRVESTHMGMGERAGNVATVDVTSRIIEKAWHEELGPDYRQSKIAQSVGKLSVGRVVSVDQSIIDNLENWYVAGEKIAAIFGQHALYRWHRTTLGNPYAHDNGSGPHDQVMAAAITNPIEYRGDKTYEWNLFMNFIMGRPKTEDIILGDPAAIDEVTVGNHAGGGKTRAIKEGKIVAAPLAIKEEASRALKKDIAQVLGRLTSGVNIN